MREPSQIVLEPEAQAMIWANRCPSCGLPKHKWNRRTDWKCCCQKCTDFFYKNLVVATSWNELRIMVFDRDEKICQKCVRVFCYQDLIADHIVPIAMGGPQWDMNNIQTLCKGCNKIKTKNDAHDIALYRRHHNKKNLKRLTHNQKQNLYQEAKEAGDIIGGIAKTGERCTEDAKEKSSLGSIPSSPTID